MRFMLVCVMVVTSFALPLAWGQEKLIFALDLIRHGDRTPLDEIPAIQYQWSEGKGQLTEKGMEQEYQLGVKLRQKYIDHYGLLPQNYENQTIFIRSTDTDRTLMSAQALMLGLYPQRKFFPIHTQPRDKDPLIPFELHTFKYQIAKEHYVYTREDWLAKEKEVQPKFKRWSQALGEEIKSLNDLKKYADVLYIHRVHQKPLPKLSEADIEEIIQTGHWAFATTYHPRAMGLFALEMFNEITRYLVDEQPHSQLKYVLFSAHDSSIMSLMSLLQAPLKVHPPYASHLSFALYEDDNKERRIRVVYNDVPVKLPCCGEKGCTLSEWKRLPF